MLKVTEVGLKEAACNAQGDDVDERVAGAGEATANVEPSIHSKGVVRVGNTHVLSHTDDTLAETNGALHHAEREFEDRRNHTKEGNDLRMAQMPLPPNHDGTLVGGGGRHSGTEC